MAVPRVDPPAPGQLVTVRGRQWVVAETNRSAPPPGLNAPTPASAHLVTLTSIEDDAYDDELRVLWELEVGSRVHEQAALPIPRGGVFDEPERLDAFLDAVRWGAITSADRTALQAPFRSGIDIEDYQLDPLVRALGMPRTNLLIADDVGLGKTIEAGLVMQELLLRHRARTVLIVCPASLTLQWRDEMAAKFGLEFRIVDTALVKELRRTRGLYTNPFTHFPRLIVSVDWLKRPRPMRLLRDLLPSGPATYPRAVDLLVVDEVHGCAPAGTGRYAIDSLRTAAIRTLAPHCEHRLFLSATPHNGYAESFSALLELLDDQRFARGVPPDPVQLARVMVRRLKSELPPRFDGTPRFAVRRLVPLEVAYPADERRVHAQLRAYAESRAAAAARQGPAARVAAEFVLLMLKKRLFSSPAAFARTLDVHQESLRRASAGPAQRPPVVSVLREILAAVDDAVDSDEDDPASFAVAQEEAFAAAAVAPPDRLQRQLLDEMRSWASTSRSGDDAKLAVFLDWLTGVVRPAGTWNDERVIVFTEYRDTQRWLAERLVAHGFGGDRLALLHGGLDTDERESVKARFLAAPDLDPMRLLLATDAASEGIDLQRHCHRLVHWEIPWNPNRLEQRNGRIDRHGQRSNEVLIHHFVGAGYADAPPGSLDGDLQFLTQAVRKVEAIRTDLGSVGPVIAVQVTEAMLGRRAEGLDTAVAEQRAARRAVLKVQHDLVRDLERLMERLRESAADLGLTPAAVERVVRTGLALARQADLLAAVLPGGEPGFRLPPLSGSWARAAVGLEHPVTRAVRPITFDLNVAQGRDDVVHVHLGHPLVQRCLRLLRAEIWSGGERARLSRVSARVVADTLLDTPAVVAHGRLVVTGAAGQRLHEEVILAGGRLREGRFVRFDSLRETEEVAASGGADLPGAAMQDRLADLWPRLEQPLATALRRRAEERSRSLDRVLLERAEADAAAARAVLAELERGIGRALTESPAVQLELFEPDERRQLDRDVAALRRRLEEIPGDMEAAEAAVRRRYADPTARYFPAAVTFYVPRRLAR